MTVEGLKVLPPHGVWLIETRNDSTGELFLFVNEMNSFSSRALVHVPYN